jgi:hypothetical protein
MASLGGDEVNEVRDGVTPVLPATPATDAGEDERRAAVYALI